MAKNSLTDTRDLIESNGQVTLSKRRSMAILQAAWETERLCVALRAATIDDDAEFVVRGITKRIQDLSEVVISGMDEVGTCATDELYRMLVIEEAQDAADTKHDRAFFADADARV